MAFKLTIKALLLSVMTIVMFSTISLKSPVEETSIVEHEVSSIQGVPSNSNYYRDFVNIIKHIPESYFSNISLPDLKEIKCMALNNYYEASTQGFIGMQAVSQVVLNRIYTKGFPHNACDVIYQKTKSTCQFSWTCQQKLPFLDYNSEAWKTAVEVARKSYFEEVSNPDLDDALFYHSIAVKPNWKNFKKITKIGDHIFYKLKQ